MFSRLKSILPMSAIRRRGPFAWFWRNRDVRYHETWTADDQRRFEFYSTLVKEGDTVFDVGANIGNRAKVFSRIGARVIAVEPQSYCLSVLRRVFRDHSNVTIVPCALGSEAGEIELLQPDPGSPIATASRDWIDAVTQHGRHAGAQWTQRTKVPVTTMNALIAQYGLPVFVKIDVEGFEPEVLLGLSQPISCVSVEFAPEFLEPLVGAVRRLEKFARLEANYILGENTTYALKEWQAPEAIFDHLSGHEGENSFWGDIYIRMQSLPA